MASRPGRRTPYRTCRAALLGAALCLGGWSGSVVAQDDAAVPAILSDPAVAAKVPLPDYSYAGYGFGVAPLPTDSGAVIDVTEYGARPDDGLDDSKAVLKAIEAADAVEGKVTVRFPKGRFIISSILRIQRGDFVLEGAGRGGEGTTLFFPRPLKIVDTSHDLDELREYLVKEHKFQREPKNNIDTLFTEYSWTGGFIQVGPENERAAAYLPQYDKRDPVLTDGVSGEHFTRTLTVSDPSKLRVGQVVELQWFSTDGENSPIIRSIYGDYDGKIGSHHWSYKDRPLVVQPTRIEAIDGRRVMIGDPLMHDISDRQPAVIAHHELLENVGIQGLRLQFPDGPTYGHHLEQGNNGIYLTGMFDGWVRDVAIHNADSGILTYDSGNLTIRNVATSGDRTAHYAVHVGNAHNVLVRDLLVTNPVVHSLSLNTLSTRAVFTHARVTSDATLDQHAGANHQNLFDDVTLSIAPEKKDGKWTYELWHHGGARYWLPPHGRYNTNWNVNVVVESGATPGETVTLTGKPMGPGERIVGVNGNRLFAVDYTPEPYLARVNQTMAAVPSLYDYQLARRAK
ncbi:glycosyl hydrolase family 28-related protein [Stakelama saccharophila]|uniref:Glycosyl hydrolase family 28-related protein n=1 Tax=Stakelama saccharophila TaxID=3075605 RepID=A0ABZ0B8V1_9SPHN|nr:glycosyl hydrolase family 28-related protein [Stakelama sp. W311]WNO53719.1 glycosyl hydrolase family 28-related protein [Stakelama sp. W311]